MRRFLLSLAIALMLALPLGCSKQSAPVMVPTIDEAVDKAKAAAVAEAPPASSDPLAAHSIDAARKAKYDAALGTALDLLAEKKHKEALIVLEAAQALHDTEEIRQEIDRVKGLITQGNSLEQSVQDIRTVLKAGNADEAARLAAAALQQFGGGDEGQRLAQLKQEADALAAAGLMDKQARQARFTQEGRAALQENNLRAAALAFEQALDAGAGADLRQELDNLRARLNRYDELRLRALNLRRDPANLEDAVASLQEAQKAWDTLQVRQEIDDYRLALLKRRERLSVADFEVLGEVGVPFAGRTFAEELLPGFKTRFDVVERAQLAPILEQLKLQPLDLAENDAGRREIGRIARVRYLVLGSISPLGGVWVHARLVDLRTGLVVQTGKVVGKTPEDAVKLLPLLARMLMMNDEERIAAENELARKAVAEAVPVAPAPIQPPPAPPIPNQPPPAPVVVFNPAPPDFGGLRPQDFDALPLLPPLGQPLPPPVIVLGQQDLFRLRLVQLNLILGDNLFSRGRFGEAFRYFDIALSLAPAEVNIRLRLERCRAFLPPVVVVPPPVVLLPRIRPRVAVLSFVVNADPRLLPPGYGDWLADNFAGQFYPWYEVVDRGEVYWWMGRLGLSMRDLLVNPAARFWLARALNVRYFAFGFVQQTASFNVAAHLVDAESGARTGFGTIHVQDRHDLKLRLSELVRQVQRDPHQRDLFVREAQDNERRLNEIRRLLREGRPAQAAQLGQQALTLRPDDIAVRTLVEMAERQAAETARQEARRQAASEQQAQLAAAQRRNAELAQQTDLARLKAEQEARARDEAGRRAQELQRDRAHDQLVNQAGAALTQNDFGQALQLLQSAVALKPSEEGYRKLGEVRAKRDEAARQQAAAEQAKREEAQRQKQEAELARLHSQLEAERKNRAAEEQARRKAQEERDQATSSKFLQDAQAQLSKGNVDAAIALLTAARQLRSTDEVKRLLTQAQEQKAKAELDKKTAAERAVLEKKLAEEKKLRDQSEAEARKKQEQFTQLMAQASKALADKHYPEAIDKFKEAGKVFNTEAVVTGLRQAEQAQAKERVQAEAEKKKKADEEQRGVRVKQLLADGQAALAARDHDKAIKLLTEAKLLSPGNVEVLSALSKAEQARLDQLTLDRERAQADVSRAQAELKKKVDFKLFLITARQAILAKRFDEALQNLMHADRLMPSDREVAALRKEAEKGKKDHEAELAKQQQAETQRLLQQARSALGTKDLPAAARAIEAAAKLAPNDPELPRVRQELQKAQEASRTEADARAAQARFQKLLDDARARLAAKDLDGAAKAVQEALKLKPNDRDALALMAQLDKVRTGAADEAKRAADAKKKADDYQKLIAEGKLLLAAKKHSEAFKTFQKALDLMPGDPTALGLLKEVDKARKDQEAELVKQQELAKRQAEMQRLLQQARGALAARDLTSATKAIETAAKLAPSDPELAKVRLELQKVQEAARVAEADARKKQEEQKRLAEVNRLVTQGQQAQAGKRFEEALKAFGEALKLTPTDPKIKAALDEAQKALDASRKPKPPNPQEEYAKQMQAAAALEKQQKWNDAGNAYREALKFVPNDPRATAGLKNIEYIAYMEEGQKAMKLKRFADAVKMFEAALKVRPNDQTATELLKKAKAGK